MPDARWSSSRARCSAPATARCPTPRPDRSSRGRRSIRSRPARSLSTPGGSTRFRLELLTVARVGSTRIGCADPRSGLADPLPPLSSVDTQRFAIGFDPRDRGRLHDLWDEVIDSQQWTEGEMVERFEEAWEAWNGVPAVAVSGWAGGAMAALDFAKVSGETVLCPSNTFSATPMATLRAGGRLAFYDCNREDLCASFEDFEAKAREHRPKAAWVV